MRSGEYISHYSVSADDVLETLRGNLLPHTDLTHQDVPGELVRYLDCELHLLLLKLRKIDLGQRHGDKDEKYEEGV